ncbi:MAG: beta-ketoacyl-[acyl-carrier-protein] synthase family protein [Planctomycetota bacterium]
MSSGTAGGTINRAGRAVVSGLGVVSPIGLGCSAFAAGLRRGESGVGPLGFDHELMRSSVAARCDGFDPCSVLPAAEAARLPRLVPMALAACREALGRVGPVEGEGARRFGLVLGTGAGGIDFTLDQAHTAYADRQRPSLWTITNATHGNLAGELSIALGLKGPSWCVSTGCGSSSDAIGQGLMLLRSGMCDRVLVCGADAHIRWETLVGMELLRVISTRDWRGDAVGSATASRPFDATRDGFVLGEGAWAMVLSRPGLDDDAGLGEVLGYSATCDAFHRVRPEPDMAESARAMRGAIEDAGVSPESVRVIQYHGTATAVNDVAETKAVRLAFGEHAERLMGSSVKSQIGHPQGASGAAGVAAVIASLGGLDGGEPFVPPTINLREAGDGCDLDYTPLDARPIDRGEAGTVALVNCLAFGAKNSALVIRV